MNQLSQSAATEALIRRFWQLMASNDFDAVAAVLSPDLVFDLPQSQERIRGPHNFARFNQEYPANGPWTFEIRRLVASTDEAVSEVAVSDGVQSGRPITFFRTADGLITSIVEFWPDPSAPGTDRRHLSEPIPTEGSA